MRRFRFLAILLLAYAGCGGGGGGGGQLTGTHLTADARGVGSNVDPASGGAAPPAGLGGAADAAEDGKDQIFREIEEADLYRVSGDLLYLLNAYRGLAIVDLAKIELVGRLPLQGFPIEMVVRGDRAFVFLADFLAGSRLLEISVADPSAPALAKSEGIDGYLRTSRVVGDVLYALTDQVARSFDLTVAPFAGAGEVDLPAGCDFAHATDSFLFLSSGMFTGTTRVTLLDISDPNGSMALRGGIDLPGYVGDDQKLHFGAGVLRVVTHDWVDRGLSRLFTIGIANPDAPVLLGSLEIAKGEQLFGTQFTEDRAYLVTFEQVDPLWVIDLSDPADPAVVGELVVPGFSTQIVADGNRLVALGVEPALGWSSVVSLFDVSDPAHPALLDRESLGDAGSNALWDRKGFYVGADRVLVPVWDGLAVVGRDAASLTLEGILDVAGGALRGFEHPAGIVALGYEEVVVADAATLALLGSVAIAENVVDTGRLSDGRRMDLVQAGDRVRVGGAQLELWAESIHPFGLRAAVVGWDTLGRAVYVVDFASNPPAVSGRLDVGWGGFAVPEAPPDAEAPGGRPNAATADGAGFIAPYFFGPDAVLTSAGKLVLRGLPSGSPHVFGTGSAADGLIVVDIPAAALGKGVEIRDGAVTGFVADGAALALTFGRFAGNDTQDRPLLRHDFVRIDLEAGVATTPVNVPGYVVAASGSDVFTIEEEWAAGWSCDLFVAASRLGAGEPTLLDRLPVPEGSYDFRAAGSTLFFTTGGGFFFPLFGGMDPSAPWMPAFEIRTVRLGEDLVEGPAIGGSDAFRSLLLAEEGAALVSRDGFTVERWDVSGATAVETFSSDLGGFAYRAHADPANPGRYLIPMGYAGVAEIP